MIKPNDRRIGEFFIDILRIKHEPLQAMRILKNCLVVECSYDYARAGLKYVAICEQFDEIEDGATAPFYEFVDGSFRRVYED